MTIYDKYIEKYELSYNENGLINIAVDSQYDWHVPSEEETNYIELSIDDLICVIDHFYQFNEELNGVEDFNGEEFKNHLKEKGYNL